MNLVNLVKPAVVVLIVWVAQSTFRPLKLSSQIGPSRRLALVLTKKREFRKRRQ